MALLENLVAGNVYIVKISASNEVGEGPFSNSVELAVLPKDASESNQRPKRLDSSDAKGLDAATGSLVFFLSLRLDFSSSSRHPPEPAFGEVVGLQDGLALSCGPRRQRENYLRMNFHLPDHRARSCFLSCGATGLGELQTGGWKRPGRF